MNNEETLIDQFCLSGTKEDFIKLQHDTQEFFIKIAKLCLKSNIKGIDKILAQKIVDLEKTVMKILSWNINGLRSNVLSTGKLSSCGWNKEINPKTDLGQIIKKYDPDMICLQETKCNEDICTCIKIPEYYQYWSNSSYKAGYAGVSIWTKFKPDNIYYTIPTLPEDDINSTGRIIVLDFGNFVLINTYSPNSGTNFKYRTEVWDIAMQKYLQQLKDEERVVVWCGDLNVSPEKIDVHSGVTDKVAGFTKEERRNFKNILNKGYIDTLRYFNPDVRALYTWWNMRSPIARPKNIGMRLDYFIISEDFIDYIENSEILINYGAKEGTKKAVSDHAPILLTVNKERK